MLGELLWLAGGAAGGFGIAALRRTQLPPEPPQQAPPDGDDGRFERLLQSLTVGIMTLDRSGHLATINAAAESIFDLGTRSTIGRAMIEAVPSFELDRRVRNALAGEAWRGALTLTAPRTRVLTVAALPIESGAIVIASDETRLHELERTRREFVSSVSHELRTPLSSINLMIETILVAPDDRNALDMFLPRVKEEVDRMIALVEDLLELARAETGQMRLRLEQLDLRDVAAGIVDTFEPRALQAGVALTVTSDPERVLIEGDRDRLAQVFVNLIDNALRHTASGGSVAIAVRAVEGRATVEVRDTGSGIPYNDLPHLFERFYVVERSRARGTSGTGLGLSIVKQIVEAHGGRITADSEFGYGATFACSFPLAVTGASDLHTHDTERRPT